MERERERERKGMGPVGKMKAPLGSDLLVE